MSERSFRARFAFLAGLAIVVAAGSGCASLRDYAAARGRDVLDPWRVRTGFGLGLYAEVEVTSFVQPAAGFADVRFDPRGTIGWPGDDRDRPGRVRTAALPLLLIGWPFYGFGETRDGYGDTHPYLRGLVSPFILMGNHHVDRRTVGLLWLPRWLGNPRLVDPDPELAALDPGPAPRTLADETWLAASGTLLFLGTDVGVNPLELLDFFTGIFGWDMLRDDDREESDAPGRDAATPPSGDWPANETDDETTNDDESETLP